MFEPATADMLFGSGQLAVTLVRPDGTILYENRLSRTMLGHESSMASSIIPSLSAPTSWNEIQLKLDRDGLVEDEPVLLQTVHGDADLCYLTVYRQYDERAQVQSLLCVWAARRKAMTSPSQSGDTGTLSEYARDLEEVIEHRAYQQLLAAEQNEYARDTLDVLPVGILVVTREGEFVYRNRAMTDDYGLRPADYLQPNVKYFLCPELNESFARLIETGLRAYRPSVDPGGKPAAVHLLPILRANAVQNVVIQFSRIRAEDAAE